MITYDGNKLMLESPKGTLISSCTIEKKEIRDFIQEILRDAADTELVNVQNSFSAGYRQCKLDMKKRFETWVKSL